MFPRKFHLCELFGIPIYLDFSLVILLLLFCTGGGSLFSGLSCALMLLLSITAHEFGHSLTARAFGYQTRDITLSLLGGCATIISMPRKASQEFLVAIAGPMVSFALSLVGAVAIWFLATQGGLFDAIGFMISGALCSFGLNVSLGDGLYVDRDIMWLVDVFGYLGIMNMALGLFNLLPGFPLDGGRIFRSAVRSFMSRERATYIAMIVGRVVAVGIALRGIYALTHHGSWGFVSLLIAWMIWREGYREYQLAKMEQRWDDHFSYKVSPPPYDD